MRYAATLTHSAAIVDIEIDLCIAACPVRRSCAAYDGDQFSFTTSDAIDSRRHPIFVIRPRSIIEDPVDEAHLLESVHENVV